MLVQLRFFFLGIVIVVMVVVFLLHAFHCHFFIGMRRLCHRDQLRRVILGGVQHIIDPGIRHTAHIAEHICPGDLCDIPHRGLIAVQIRSVLHQQCQIYTVHAAGQLARPIILRKDGADHLEPAVRLRQRTATSSQKDAPPQAERQQKCKSAFHSFSLSPDIPQN